MYRKLGKRGLEDKLNYVIFELFAVFVVALVILISLRGIVNNSGFWKKYYSTDLGLMSDLENTNQGDFVMNYALKDTKTFLTDKYAFEMVLKPNYFATYDVPKEDDKYPTTYPFAKASNVVVRESDIISNFLVLYKLNSELSLDTYYVGANSGCPALDTRKDTTALKFKALSLDPVTNQKSSPYAQSVANALSIYGRVTPDQAVNELTILLVYDPKSSFSTFYSDDSNQLRSQKMACLVAKQFIPNPNGNVLDNVNKYDGFLDANQGFSDYINNKDTNEFWIIIRLSDNELKMQQNAFADLVLQAVNEYYK